MATAAGRCLNTLIECDRLRGVLSRSSTAHVRRIRQPVPHDWNFVQKTTWNEGRSLVHVDSAAADLGHVLINAQIAAGLRAHFAVMPSLILVLLPTVVQKKAHPRAI